MSNSSSGASAGSIIGSIAILILLCDWIFPEWGIPDWIVQISWVVVIIGIIGIIIVLALVLIMIFMDSR